jgi:copper chaperone CopZ
MAQNNVMDQLVLIRIEGMHCLKCEQSIKKALQRERGVHEVEVDFNSAQASVLFDQSATTVTKLTEIVGAVGYRVLGVTQADAK